MKKCQVLFFTILASVLLIGATSWAAGPVTIAPKATTTPTTVKPVLINPSVTTQQNAQSANLVAVTVVNVESHQVTVRDGAGNTRVYQASPALVASNALGKFKAGDSIRIETQRNILVKVEGSLSDIGQKSTQAVQVGREIQEVQSSANPNRHRVGLPSTSVDPSLTFGPPAGTDANKPGLKDVTGRKGPNPLTTGSRNPTISSTSARLEGGGGQSMPQATTATQSRMLGQDLQGKGEYRPGADPRLGKGSWVRETVGKIAAALVGEGKDRSLETSGGGGGIRGFCADTTDVCAATGRTWEQLSAQEKTALCDGVRSENDKVKGGGAAQSVSTGACEGSLREPNWEKILDARLNPLIHTTEEQGSRGETLAPQVVKTKKGGVTDLKGTLPDPIGTESGGHPGPSTLTPSPSPTPDAAGGGK